MIMFPLNWQKENENKSKEVGEPKFSKAKAQN